MKAVGGPLDGQELEQVGRRVIVPFKTDYELPEAAVIAHAACMAYGKPFPWWLLDELGKQWGEWVYLAELVDGEVVWKFVEDGDGVGDGDGQGGAGN